MGAEVTRPRWGFSPNTPHQLAGSRMLPPPSPPIPIATMPAATAAPVPPEDPAGERSRFHGFRVMPFASDSVNGQMPNSGMRVVPTTTAPAARRRRTTSPSADAGVLLPRPPKPVTTPATSFSSLIATGTPCNGPRTVPDASSASSAAASARASSRTCAKAFSCGSRAAIVARLCSTSASEVVSPAATSRACSVRERKESSGIDAARRVSAWRRRRRRRSRP